MQRFQNYALFLKTMGVHEFFCVCTVDEKAFRSWLFENERKRINLVRAKIVEIPTPTEKTATV